MTWFLIGALYLLVGLLLGFVVCLVGWIEGAPATEDDSSLLAFLVLFWPVFVLLLLPMVGMIEGIKKLAEVAGRAIEKRSRK